MQSIIIEKPYRFIPPLNHSLWPTIIRASGLVDLYLRWFEGVGRYRLEGIEHLKSSLAAGHGILLAPNHSRYADPLTLGWVSKAAGTHMFSMASWHLFHGNFFRRWSIRAMGAFSVYREGIDRQSIDTAVRCLVEAKRTLVVFPEGSIFRTNDQLQALLDGVAFIARTAARRRAKADPTAKVVIHPVGIKYILHGDVDRIVTPVLDRIERRLTWEHSRGGRPIRRIQRIINGLMALKEIEYFGAPGQGDLVERQQRLLDHLLGPLEARWLGGQQSGAIINRVKSLRMKIMPELLATTGESTPARQKCWRDLAAIYLAQQVASYPVDYLRLPTTDMRVLETVERLEEDLTDRATRHGGLEAVIEVDEPIEVPIDRAPRDTEDPVMVQLRERMEQLVQRQRHLARLYRG